MAEQQHYFFVGIGGSGMSTLADLVRRAGHRVSGSDRGYDRGDTPDKFATLSAAGIVLHLQDGSGINDTVSQIVVSSAIEDSIPDIRKGRDLGIPIVKRAEVLAAQFNAGRGIGIAGTSGKTTVTGMTGWILHAMGLGPTIANGGVMPNFIGHPDSLLGNAVYGESGLFVAEMDESDGTIALFNPSVAVLNNITLDHKPFDVIEPMFRDYLLRARDMAVVNIDDPRAARMAFVHPRTITVSAANATAVLSASDIAHTASGMSFNVNDRRDGAVYSCRLALPGRHNVLNALCALAAVSALGLPLDRAVPALESFRGIRRRLEVVGTTASGVTVIDDFAHNPDKVAAALAALTVHPGRLLVMFQPHGFGPMVMMRREMVEAFVQGTRPGDMIVMPEIFYAGGTVSREISSKDLIGDIATGGRASRFFETRALAGDFLTEIAKPGDRIVVMGARDDTLTVFARGLVDRLDAMAPAA